jgi:transcriptional regulator with XRE-family HTH domain
MSKLSRAIADARKTAAYWTERAVLDYTSKLWGKMKERDLSQRALAQRVAKSPAYVSRVLNGSHNVTIKTMVELAHAIDYRLRIELVPEDLADFEMQRFTIDNAGPRLGTFQLRDVPRFEEYADLEEKRIAA